ncbi:DNA repair protein RecN (Recombination protein N) [Pseudoalteromonas nigrifaciens]|uniref:DNA repair protein RecN n=1 Tax=Pseudoalteromonas nigrifaciens TaxID=28109 RepID=A0AAC9UJ27_9GAMM|nr:MULTISPECIES: DNA repair protein RecN [Pseudoalteromonas]ASM53722.1 DNA repair protein RecN (Recombination protein N) [Pseudoalteromonas nigrifaciens]MBB1404218.1 DNA repair protein RecN [Pseudoalteromonas sp. SG44-5]GEN40715.1 DNA repair protein RecN [Pseudoalteromonas nigrifaciens]SUC52435.1 Recombination protein N [Pseudoalteromonas nigrifaciens]
MLIGLEIKNFAIVSNLSTEWQNGMTAITGETGAGKSIAIDALSLCLGERAEASAVRPNTDKAEVCAQFDLSNLPLAHAFLEQNMLSNTDNECLLRRVVCKNGRSKSYINGSAVTAAQLKELGQYLISIHGQHAHQHLLKAEHQLQLLDAYAGHHNLVSGVSQSYKQFANLQKEFKHLQQQQQQQAAQKQLLEYQVAELNEFALQEGEFEQIEAEHYKLSNSQTILETCQRELQHLYESDEQNACSLLQHSAQQFSELAQYDETLASVATLLAEAAVQVEEASREVRSYTEQADLDPARLVEVENRLSGAMDLARKHHIKPQALVEFHQAISQELESISNNSSRLEQLESEIENTLSHYQHASEQLSQSRREYANTLNRLISNSMANLSMENGIFEIALTQETERAPNSLGYDNVSFLVSTNPGQPLQPLAKVASGGELSRISLAIQVIIAQKVTTPTLIFDEVDVGISGPTASAVGKLLRQLGKSTQVICVTHLPQVASSAHQQFFVAKEIANGETFTHMQPLNKDGRVNEIARLLGGDNISKTAKANAKELIMAHA